MKAIACPRYGLLELREVETPVPGDGEVLVESHASSVTVHNLGIVSGKPLFVRLMGTGVRRPRIRIPGSDLAGRVQAIGRNVTRFRPGDEAYGDLTLYGFGALAEYVSVAEDALSRKPANLSFEEAAAVPQAALVALQGLRDKGRITAGQKVLVLGASGGIGTFAVQVARSFDAEVTGVCSTKNLELVRSLGADHVIDYTVDDFTKNGQRYDLIFATAYRSIFECRRALSPGGIYVSTGGPSLGRILQDMLIGPMVARNEGWRLAGGWALVPNQGLDVMTHLIEAGKVRPAIDHVYPLGQAADAFEYFAKGHARGKVIVRVR